MRNDIQALRGLAVLFVVLHHTQIAGLRSGFLGVDIFFVISGYLITRLVRDRIERGEFRFAEFYARRANRLLPAAYTTFLLVAIGSVVLLAQTELHDFARQLAGAVTFSGNFALWAQTGYFDGNAELKPLLHVWSLAIEEQYYLILPALLVFTPRRYWASGAWAVFIASFGVCAIVGRNDPSAAFYLLPARAWELAIGSLGALALDGGRLGSGRMARWLYVPSLIALVAVPFAPIAGAHPGPNALVVCVATLVVILRAHDSISRAIPVRVLAWFGDFSYSLYLVHWPIAAFAANLWVGGAPFRLRLALGAASIALGYAMYRLVEQPVRQANRHIGPRRLAAILAGSLVLVAIPYAGLRLQQGPVDYAQLRTINMGSLTNCGYSPGSVPDPRCQPSAHPSVLIWGDSIAMGVASGIAPMMGPDRAVQITLSACGPLLGLAPVERKESSRLNRHWAEKCSDFNEETLRHIANTASIEVVVLSSLFRLYLDSYRRVLEDRQTVRDASERIALAHGKRTIEAVRKLGKRVVIVAPPPSFGFDIGLCLERKATGKPILGPNRTCEIPFSRYQAGNVNVRELLRKLSEQAAVEVIHFEDVLCDRDWCKTSLDETPLYRDDSHFSQQGSRIVALRMHMVDQIMAKAR